MAKDIHDAAQEAEFEDMPFETDEEGEAPDEYSEDAAKRAGDAINEKIADDPRYEEAPDGTAGAQDQEREARAARARNDPNRGFSEIERAQLAEFGAIRAGRNAGRKAKALGTKPELEGAVRTLLRALNPSLAQESEDDPMGLDIGAPESEGGQVIQTRGEFLLVQNYGGTWNVHRFDQLAQVQGFAQNMKGLKRLFKRPANGNKYQEINGIGLPIDRA